MLACLSLLAVAPARSHGVAWRLLALLIPLVRALARRSGGPGCEWRCRAPLSRMELSILGVTLGSAMVLCPRCEARPGL